METAVVSTALARTNSARSAGRYLSAIAGDWRSARDDWQSQGTVVHLYCAYEKLPLDGVIVVDKSSATQLCEGESVAINANHFDIVKPASRKDMSYIFLKNRWVGLFRPSSR